MIRLFCCFFLCLLISASALEASSQKKVSRDGYVTHLNPPSSFQLNQQRVVVTPATKLVLDRTVPPIEEDFSFDWASPGKHIEVSGVEDAQTHVLTAKRVEVVRWRLASEGFRRRPGRSRSCASPGWDRMERNRVCGWLRDRRHSRDAGPVAECARFRPVQSKPPGLVSCGTAKQLRAAGNADEFYRGR